MKILSDVQGHRIDNNTHPSKAGEYSKMTCETPGVWWPGKPYWMICTPNGIYGNLVNHKCIEEVDGSLTVPSPGPGEGANSILATDGSGNRSWHGFMKNGCFKELG